MYAVQVVANMKYMGMGGMLELVSDRNTAHRVGMAFTVYFVQSTPSTVVRTGLMYLIAC
jgi:hypothetical protein